MLKIYRNSTIYQYSHRIAFVLTSEFLLIGIKTDPNAEFIPRTVLIGGKVCLFLCRSINTLVNAFRKYGD